VDSARPVREPGTSDAEEGKHHRDEGAKLNLKVGIRIEYMPSRVAGFASPNLVRCGAM
jgi:hypothetical protein